MFRCKQVSQGMEYEIERSRHKASRLVESINHLLMDTDLKDKSHINLEKI